MSPNKLFSSGAYFIADAHLGMPIAGYEQRETALNLFLKEISGKATHLFIVGDLFDFWVEYRHAIRPEYFSTLHHLKLCADSGVEIHYLAGNHDFALEEFLPDQIGITIHKDSFRCTLQGKKLFLHHGDGLIRQDRAYRVLKWLLRNRVYQRLYKMIHPDLGIGFASFLSKTSRKYLVADYHREMLKNYQGIAEGYINQGDEIVVFAHTHFPQLKKFSKGVFCNPGEWIRRYTFARLADGELSLWEYRIDQPPMPVSIPE
jgi:UDP-2,3-diacylglucosamine hydrolase